MKNFIHKNAAEGAWFKFSIAEQLGNIGSEVHRVISAKGKDEQRYEYAIVRALDLFDVTLENPHLRGARLREISLAREVFCDAIYGGKEYGSTLEDSARYLDQFAMAAAIKRAGS